MTGSIVMQNFTPVNKGRHFAILREEKPNHGPSSLTELILLRKVPLNSCYVIRPNLLAKDVNGMAVLWLSSLALLVVYDVLRTIRDVTVCKWGPLALLSVGVFALLLALLSVSLNYWRDCLSVARFVHIASSAHGC